MENIANFDPIYANIAADMLQPVPPGRIKMGMTPRSSDIDVSRDIAGQNANDSTHSLQCCPRLSS